MQKQNNVRKNGKGKFDVTVPILFEFQKYPNEQKSSRQVWLENEVKLKEQELESHLKTRIKPTPIPETTTKNIYEHLLEKDKIRRRKSKEESLAKNKAMSKPFSFHEAD